MNDSTTATFEVLLVDDDDVALESVLRSFKKHSLPCATVLAGDGMEALEIVRNQHASKRMTKPYIVLLDLNMPRMDGFGFLEAIRQDPALKSTMVFVLTTSSRDTDRSRAYNENVAGYMVKSAVGPQFAKLANFISQLTTSVELP